MESGERSVFTFPLPTLLRAGYSVKLIRSFGPHLPDRRTTKSSHKGSERDGNPKTKTFTIKEKRNTLIHKVIDYVICNISADHISIVEKWEK